MGGGEAGDGVAFHVDGGSGGLLIEGGFLGGGRERCVGAGEGLVWCGGPWDESRDGSIAGLTINDMGWVDKGAGRQGRVEAPGDAEAEEGGGAVVDEVLGCHGCAVGRAAADGDVEAECAGEPGLGLHADDDSEHDVMVADLVDWGEGGLIIACIFEAIWGSLDFLGRRLMRIGFVVAAMLAVALPAAARDWTVVRFGMDATYPPFESVDPSGAIVGFEVDYAKALCVKMKVSCTFQNQDWDGVIPALLANKFDVIFSSMNMTPARAQRLLFSDMYYATAPVWVTAAGTKSDDVSPTALKGKSVGTQSSTIFAAYLDKLYPGVDIKLYPGGDEPFMDLASGRLDYTVGDILVAEKFMAGHAGCCRIVTEIPRTPDIFGPGVAAAFRPTDTDLAAMFNKAIAEADADGTYKQIAARYFKIDIRGK